MKVCRSIAIIALASPLFFSCASKTKAIYIDEAVPVLNAVDYLGLSKEDLDNKLNQIGRCEDPSTNSVPICSYELEKNLLVDLLHNRSTSLKLIFNNPVSSPKRAAQLVGLDLDIKDSNKSPTAYVWSDVACGQKLCLVFAAQGADPSFIESVQISIK